MNEPMDRVLADWLDEGPETGPREGLERALAATRRVGQRPGWTFPERWLPMQLTMTQTPLLRPMFAVASTALLIAALAAAALFVGSQRQSPSLFRNGAVVWSADGDLYIADELGGTPRSLVAGPEVDSDPIFSEQGDRIAFIRDTPDDLAKVMTVSPDGSDIKALATPQLVWDLLGWSPDGDALLANTFGQDSSEQIYVISSDGSGHRLLAVDPSLRSSRHASWRPGGQHIAVRVEQDGGYGLAIADANGTGARQLPIGPFGQLGDLAWSPDGNHLSFTSSVGHVNIADIDANGTMTQLRDLKLDSESSDESSATWSPDGSQLAFVQIKGSRSQIAVVEPDGSGYRIVVPDIWDAGGGDFAWSPDGRSLVIFEHSNDDLRGKVWSVDVATGEKTEVKTPVQSWQRLAP